MDARPLSGREGVANMRGDNTVNPEGKAIAIIRRSQPGVCQKMGQALYKGGIRLVEIIFDQKIRISSQTAQASSARSKEYKETMKIDAGAATTPELQGPRQTIKMRMKEIPSMRILFSA